MSRIFFKLFFFYFSCLNTPFSWYYRNSNSQDKKIYADVSWSSGRLRAAFYFHFLFLVPLSTPDGHLIIRDLGTAGDRQYSSPKTSYNGTSAPTLTFSNAEVP